VYTDYPPLLFFFPLSLSLSLSLSFFHSYLPQ
jgi:hypothetical protein